jgi:SAM-dependent methyltransferase
LLRAADRLVSAASNSEAREPAPYAPPLAICVVLDVRPEAIFRAGHLEGCGNIPLLELRERRAELPSRRKPVLIVGASVTETEAAAAILSEMEFDHVFRLAAPIAESPDGLASLAPAVRLWRPASFLEELIADLPDARTGTRRALDVAAGSGRNAVFLALHGFEVEAIDHAPEALARAEALARRSGVRITTRIADLESESPPIDPDRYDLVVCFRFLHRPLLPVLSRALAPGGHLVYETFRIGQERFGKPRRAAFLLEPGELARAFQGLEALRYEEPDFPDGPVLARIHARRTALENHPSSGSAPSP